MKNQSRPMGMTIFILWAGIMGFFIAWDGWSYFVKGMDVGNAPDVWVQDLRGYVLPGILWMAGGLGFCASAFGLWAGRSWARIVGLYSGPALVVGCVLIKLISLGFGNPAPLLSLFVGIPALYLLTDEAKAFSSE